MITRQWSPSNKPFIPIKDFPFSRWFRCESFQAFACIRILIDVATSIWTTQGIIITPIIKRRYRDSFPTSGSIYPCITLHVTWGSHRRSWRDWSVSDVKRVKYLSLIWHEVICVYWIWFQMRSPSPTKAIPGTCSIQYYRTLFKKWLRKPERTLDYSINFLSWLNARSNLFMFSVAFKHKYPTEQKAP